MGQQHGGFHSKYVPGDRLQHVIQYNQDLAVSGRRNLYTADNNQLVYHWTDKANGIVPQTGEWSSTKESSYSLGDHACRVDIGMGFPFYDQVPSHVEGYEATPLSWGRDYAFLLDHSPAEIHPYEFIVGEFHWEMNEIRKYYFGDHVHELGRQVRALGAGGTSHGHTCLDFSIGLTKGWGGILQQIEASLAMFRRLDVPVCEGIMRDVKKKAVFFRESGVEKPSLLRERGSISQKGRAA